ncbi:FAD/NAD(P)-binding domain-containing protein [Athelia psychrophila]|uniref:FAD/NAD(P)-binding domain-containing protein n=1 Tax=Athelia psychrophila TaxID=1759441 RepID=A0A166I9W7_9AGAM|nr:FAD/NAD(P)-binding domain-containing protein [Fibularhizoctonia sp. CBS 109695]
MMPSTLSLPSPPPQHAQILVIGGGPAGSYAAAALAREGFDVALLEASKFPRYHVGESLIPSIRHYMRFIGAEEKLVAHGFVRKPGSSIKFTQYRREGYTDFVALGHNNNAWNVVRSEFDELLLNHARSCGVKVTELTRVKSLAFSETDPSRPISATWSTSASHSNSDTSAASSSQANPSDDPAGAMTGTTTFDYVIDATGRAGLISNTYLKNRRFNASLKNIALWGYWKDVTMYGGGTDREGSPYFEALTDETGWAWYIPLHDGTTSIGIVMNQKAYNANKPKPTPDSPSPSLTARYRSYLSLAPGTLELIGDGVLTTKPVSPPNSPNGPSEKEFKSNEPLVKCATDFSYSADRYAGNGYRIVGDAGSFIDPFFSSGIHLAMTSALSAASTISAALRGDCTEGEASEWHSLRVAMSYTRFQVVVLSAYKQICAQKTDVLCDIDEDNYDRAMRCLRPVLQGASDMGARLSENELQKSLDFCVKLFDPTCPEQHERVAQSGVPKELMDIHAPIMNPKVLEDALKQQQSMPCKPEGLATILDEDMGQLSIGGGGANPQRLAPPPIARTPDRRMKRSDSDAERTMVVNKINARKVMHSEYSLNNLEVEEVNGLVVRLQRGNLGLMKAKKTAN